MSVRKTVATVGSAGAVVACCVAFTPKWEGTDYVAKPDPIGTGHPITWCHGQTNSDRSAANQVRAGQRFTKEECDAELAKSLPKYLEPLGKCVHVPVPVKSMAAALDAGYNAGSAAVCRSPMVAQFNAGNIRAGCEAFKGWYVRSAGQERKGLIARRSGIGDGRKSERDLCLEGVNDPDTEWYLHDITRVVSASPPPPAPVVPPKTACSWWRRCK